MRNYLLLYAALGSPSGGIGSVRLLLDTGASYTMLPVDIIEKLGYDTYHPAGTVRIITASGILVAPVVAVSWLHCLGRRVENFPVVAHTLPVGTFAQGVLGMDWLTGFKAVISVGEAEIRSSFR